jgi:hypothetical protein
LKAQHPNNEGYVGHLWLVGIVGQPLAIMMTDGAAHNGEDFRAQVALQYGTTCANVIVRHLSPGGYALTELTRGAIKMPILTCVSPEQWAWPDPDDSNGQEDAGIP